jgi:hypothetical protein
VNVRRLGRALVVVAGVVLLVACALPVQARAAQGVGGPSPDATCGPAITAVVGWTTPTESDALVPERPGADFGNSRAVMCEGDAFYQVGFGLLAGAVLLAIGLLLIDVSAPKPLEMSALTTDVGSV